MVCPKCGHNGPEGNECSACGVIFDKFRRQGGSEGGPRNIASTGGAMLMPKLPKSRHDRVRNLPLGQRILRGLVLIVVLGGLGALLDYMRLHLLGANIAACIKAATATRVFKDRHVDHKAVLLSMMGEARERNYELPADRIWLQIRPRSTDSGTVLEVIIKVHQPAKLMGFIKFDIFREGATRAALTTIRGFAAYETPESATISRDLAAMGNL